MWKCAGTQADSTLMWLATWTSTGSTSYCQSPKSRKLKTIFFLKFKIGQLQRCQGPKSTN